MPQGPPQRLPQFLQGSLVSQASPILYLLCPQRTSSVLKTRRPASGHVSQFRASPWPPLKSRLGDPATCPLGHMGSHQASNVWQKQMIDSSAHRPHPPGRSALPGGPWFLPLALPPVAPDRGPASTILWPQSLLATQQPPGSSCQVTAAASSLSWPPPSTHGPASHPLTAARAMLLESQIITLLC